MATKILHIKVILFLLLQCMLISAVNSEDLICQAGEGASSGAMLMSGESQCSGLSKITTEAECKAAAEYNSKNNIDNKWRRTYHYALPPGCFYHSDYDKYYWNDNTKSRQTCSYAHKCICKPNICTKCPSNTYSEGGINPRCTTCPQDRPITKDFKTGQTSIDSCVPLKCKPGEGLGPNIFTSGSASQCSGLSKITTEAECNAAAEYNSRNNIDKNEGYRGRWRSKSGNEKPPGCFVLRQWSGNRYYFNDETTSTYTCSKTNNCICKVKPCNKCPINTYSKGGSNPTCTPCPKETPTTNFKIGQSKCIPVPTIKCEPGYGVINDGITKPKTCAKCPINTYNDKGGIDPTCTPCPEDRPFTIKFSDQKSSASCTKSKDDFFCTAGKSMAPTSIFTSGFPSQCSGLSKITTEAECKAAAEYNSKNDVDKNEGYAGTPNFYLHGGYFPYGCYYNGYHGFEYWFNPRKTTMDYGYDNPNPQKCSGNIKCICKPNICTNCPINTYSEGGINPRCTTCPQDRPITKDFKTGQTSIDSCVPLKCPGEFLGPNIFTSGSASQCSGLSKITTEAECKAVAEYNSKNNIHKNEGYGGGGNSRWSPPGCSYEATGSQKYFFNDYTESPEKCSRRWPCICKPKTCSNNGPKNQILRNHLAKNNQDQDDENVGGGRVYGKYNKGPYKTDAEYNWDQEDGNDDVGGGRIYGEYNKGPYKAGGEYNWDQVDANDDVGGRGRVYGEYNKGPYKAGGEYNWDQVDANDDVGGRGRVYGEYNKGPYKAGGEYNWDQVGADDDVGGRGRVYGEYNKGPYKAGGEYNWDQEDADEENVGAAPHWTLLKWLIKADMKRCTACGGLCEKTMMDKRTKMCHCVQDARCLVDCRNGGDCYYRGHRRLSTTKKTRTTLKPRKLGSVSYNCYFVQQRLCGHCGDSNSCRSKCNRKHESKLRNACGLRRLMHSVNNDGRGRRSLRTHD